MLRNNLLSAGREYFPDPALFLYVPAYFALKLIYD